MAGHSSVPAWRIPGTEEPGGLLSVGSHSQMRLKLLSSSSSSMETMKQYLYFSLTIRTHLSGQDTRKVPFYSQRGHGTSHGHL